MKQELQGQEGGEIKLRPLIWKKNSRFFGKKSQRNLGAQVQALVALLFYLASVMFNISEHLN